LPNFLITALDWALQRLQSEACWHASFARKDRHFLTNPRGGQSGVVGDMEGTAVTAPGSELTPSPDALGAGEGLVVGNAALPPPHAQHASVAVNPKFLPLNP
jgi:hypothetical protein